MQRMWNPEGVLADKKERKIYPYFPQLIVPNSTNISRTVCQQRGRWASDWVKGFLPYLPSPSCLFCYDGSPPSVSQMEMSYLNANSIFVTLKRREKLRSLSIFPHRRRSQLTGPFLSFRCVLAFPTLRQQDD